MIWADDEMDLFVQYSEECILSYWLDREINNFFDMTVLVRVCCDIQSLDCVWVCVNVFVCPLVRVWVNKVFVIGASSIIH